MLRPWLDVDPAAVLPGHGPVAALLAALGPDAEAGMRRRDDLALTLMTSDRGHRHPHPSPRPRAARAGHRRRRAPAGPARATAPCRAFPLTAGVPLAVLGVAEAIGGSVLRARIRHRPGTRPVQPLVAARAVLVARALRARRARSWPARGPGCSATSPRAARTSPPPRRHAAAAAIGLVGALALVAGALWLQHCCRTPDDPADGAGPDDPAPDAAVPAAPGRVADAAVCGPLRTGRAVAGPAPPLAVARTSPTRAGGAAARRPPSRP